MSAMQWFNPPEKWSASDGVLKMFVTAKTDYWRVTHYGFIVDDGPFYYAQLGGEFEAKVRLIGNYQSRYDQMGLMIRRDEKTWIKAGVEYVNETINVSAVVTHGQSDWSLRDLNSKSDSIWIKTTRRLDAVEVAYSLDDRSYQMIRMAYFPPNCPVMLGMTAASPDGPGFEALFEGFQIRHLPDLRRSKWLESNN